MLGSGIVRHSRHRTRARKRVTDHSRTLDGPALWLGNPVYHFIRFRRRLKSGGRVLLIRKTNEMADLPTSPVSHHCYTFTTRLEGSRGGKLADLRVGVGGTGLGGKAGARGAVGAKGRIEAGGRLGSDGSLETAGGAGLAAHRPSSCSRPREAE